ncbi:MAG: surface-adhesin E family protein [Betaproteobacteria bacterium]
MRRWFERVLLAFLGLTPGLAPADWTRVGEGDYIHDAYADRQAIRRLGDNIAMPGLYDFKKTDLTPEGLPFRSTVVVREYDCRGRQVRMLSFIDFAEPMGSGAVVGTAQRTGRWEAVVEGALDDRFLQVACDSVRY